jgi:Tfp pilus assembly protein PilN
MRAVNLIPSESRRGAAAGAGRSEGAIYAVMAVIGGFAVLALLYGVARHQVGDRRTQLATTAVQTERAQAAAGQLTPYTSFLALREQRTQAVSQLVDSRFDWAHAFHEIGRVLPKDASISSLSGAVGSASTTAAGSSASATAKSAAVASATPPGSIPTFTLTGCATSQAEVARTLGRLRLIDGVNEVTLQSSTKSSSQGASSGGGGCPSGAPAFSVLVTFDPLPAAPAASTSNANLTTPTGGAG